MKLLPLRRRFLIAVWAALCTWGVLGCGSRAKLKPGNGKSASHERKIIEVRESKELAQSGEATGASAWSAGDIEVWYRDIGDQLLVATRSGSRVLVHADVNRNGGIDGGLDRVYGVRTDGSITCEYVRPVWATASWGEVKTIASAAIRKNAGSSETIIWKLPKEELGSGQDGADLTFEIFDERYQTNQFGPGLPFEAILRLKYSRPSGKSPSEQEVPKNPASSTLVTSATNPPKNQPANKVSGAAHGNGSSDAAGQAVRTQPEVARRKEIPIPGGVQEPTQTTGVSPPAEPAPVTPQTRPSFSLSLHAAGTQIEAGHTYRQDDPRFADGSNLILSIEYQGVVPGHTELAVEWYVGPKPVSFFPTLKVSNRAGRWSRAYDNRTVEAGEHKIILKVNGQDGPALAFTVDPVGKQQ